ncbi:hypothetical protein D5086_033517 [Populus alba]|uniref:Uncharacterized protein n=1 Tax=Populus alba TaxID=43335 RepID=A0ACC4AH04_POPAL
MKQQLPVGSDDIARRLLNCNSILRHSLIFTTGTMLDIIMGIIQCEREHAEGKAKLLEAQNSAGDASFTVTESES